MATAKKTQIRAQTQLNNETDVAGSDGHLILADGSVKMDSEYAISDRKAIAHSGFVAGRLSSLLGVADSLTASLAWTAAEAPLLSGSVTVKAALTKLANELDDQGLGTTSLQDEMDETQQGAGLAATGEYVASASANYIASATSIHNATQILDAQIKTASDAYIAADTAQSNDLASTTSAKGAALIGYDGQTGANGDFSITAKQVDAALDDIVSAIDADRQEFDVFEAALLANATGGSKVGYNGKTDATNGLFSVSAGNLEDSLDAIVVGIDAEMKVLDDYQGELLSQVGAKGAAKIGYDGQAGSNSKFTLAASQVDAALDSVVAAVDANRHALGAMITNAGAYNAFSGTNYIDSSTDVTDAISDIDTAIGAALANMGLTSAGQIDLVAGNVRYIKTGASIETSVEGALDKLDQALDTLETAVVDTKSGNAAFVRKGDHLTEEFDASEGDTTFTISAEAHQESVMVFVNGMLQRMGASYDWQFGVSDDKIVLQQASEADDYVVIKYVKKTSA